jgi:hypothetical protein
MACCGRWGGVSTVLLSQSAIAKVHATSKCSETCMRIFVQDICTACREKRKDMLDP